MKLETKSEQKNVFQLFDHLIALNVNWEKLKEKIIRKHWNVYHCCVANAYSHRCTNDGKMNKFVWIFVYVKGGKKKKKKLLDTELEKGMSTPVSNVMYHFQQLQLIGCYRYVMRILLSASGGCCSSPFVYEKLSAREWWWWK